MRKLSAALRRFAQFAQPHLPRRAKPALEIAGLLASLVVALPMWLVALPVLAWDLIAGGRSTDEPPPPRPRPGTPLLDR